ncbi:hypothetical protein ACIBCM_27650 [Streptomyces sp. NPDC051018]|uniref:hypothetical protein n=1 Tax=Streptomyces sp. NPDC051018 TaxID=3365639 RepID=UPI0037BA3C33
MAFTTKNNSALRQLARPVDVHAQLVDVRSFLLHAEIRDMGAAGELQGIKSLETTMGVGREKGNLTFHFEFEIMLQGAQGKDAVKLQVHLGALFEFPDDGDPGGDVTEESLVAFGQTTARLAVHPYLRAAVSDLTARLGCPPVTLGLLKL